MNEQTDLTLWNSMARQRDKAALEELWERYSTRMFSLAFNILGHAGLAEDAVQEALLSIWQRAKPVEPVGTVADWISKIVIYKSFDLRRDRGRCARREARAAAQREAARLAGAEAESIDAHDLIAWLRDRIDHLPELERALLTCCYGANLSHREIAKLVGIPNRTVTFKIQRILERLRAELTRAGVTAALSPLQAETLSEALTAGHPGPMGFDEKLFGRIAEASTQTALRLVPRRAAPVVAKPGAWGLAGLIIAFGATATAGGWWWMHASGAQPALGRPASPATSPEQLLAPGPQALAAMDDGPPLHALWDFAKGPAEDLTFYGNGDSAWHWQKVDGQGMMTNESKNGSLGACVFLPQRLRPRPHRITLDFTAVGADRGDLGAIWFNAAGLLPRQSVSLTATHMPRNLIEFYVLGAHVVLRVDHIPCGVTEYSSPYPSARMCLWLKNCRVRKIAVDELDPSDPSLLNINPLAEVALLKRRGARTSILPQTKLDWERVTGK